VRSGTCLSVDDSSLSYSPCYCAPEWARFLTDDSSQPEITASPALDVWSIGMTACELITLQAAMSPQFSKCKKPGMSSRRALYEYMKWLGKVRQCPVGDVLSKYDKDFEDLLEHLLVGDAKHRWPLAAALDHPYLAAPNPSGEITLGKTNSSPVTIDVLQSPKARPPLAWSWMEDYATISDDDDHDNDAHDAQTGSFPVYAADVLTPAGCSHRLYAFRRMNDDA